MTIGVIGNESTLALMVEVTEGVYVAPTSGTDYVDPLADGLEMNKSREELTRDLLGGSVEAEASRVGVAEASGTIPLEFKASATEGDAPQALDVSLRSLLGGKRQITADQTSSTGHSSTVITFADTSAFSVGDIVLVKEAGAFEARPISAITTNTSITFPFALDNGAPSDAVVVAQCTTYYSDTSNAVTMSAEHNLGSAAIKQKVTGLRAVSGSIENYSAGSIPSMSFSVQGLDIERLDEDADFAPDLAQDGLPPVALEACFWLNGTKLSYTELGLNIENTVSTIADACAASGKIGSRITEQVTTLSVNPYLDDSDLTNTWNKFNANDTVSSFFYAFNPSAVDGEFSECVAGWLPQGKITETPISDVDGILAEAVTVKAFKSLGSDSVFLGFV